MEKVKNFDRAIVTLEFDKIREMLAAVCPTEGAKALIEWLTGDEASALIAKYGEEQYGEALFYLIEE